MEAEEVESEPFGLERKYRQNERNILLTMYQC
jgi:hypothetical protein